jgi:hypothetical protein
MNNIKLSYNNLLHPNWITGFVDAEGCFTIKINKSKGKILLKKYVITNNISNHKSYK